MTIMNRAPFLVLLFVAFSALTVEPQQPPYPERRLPELAPNRIEVRFAVGEKAVRCKQFHLTAKVGTHVVLAGYFSNGFYITPNLRNLPQNDALDLELRCGKFKWHFSGVGERAFLTGWWWVGTDYQPFQQTFKHWQQLKDAVWVRYLIVNPNHESGFVIYKFCPAKLKDANPGPCFVD
jgi:hypothetical protein